MYRAVKPVTMGVRMSSDMHDVLLELAQKDQESMGSVVRAAIRSYMRRRGYDLHVSIPDGKVERLEDTEGER